MVYESFEKRDIFRDGVWCIADMGTDAYHAAFERSQAKYSWAGQALYGHYMIYFCVVIIALFIVKRLIYYFVDNSSKTIKDNSNWAKSWYYKICAVNRWICYRRFPSIICNIFQLPSSMGNFLLIMGGCLYMLCYTFIPKVWYRGCRGFGSPPLAVRAGMESTALVPLIFILSGKTNLISQLTNISYEKLNVYHRWVSIMCCFLGWVHTIPFYVQAVREGGRDRLAYYQSNNAYFVNGIPPIVFLTILTIFSHSYIRAAWYELWLQVHWIAALGFYISLFYHCFPQMNSWKYMVATVVFWVAQLGWRAVNKAMLRPNKGFLRANPCKMRRYASNGDKEHYFEVVIENTNDFSWVPGQHLFLRIPGLRFLENHPFSIVSTFEPRENSDIRLIVKAIGWGGMTDHLYKKLPDTDYTESNVFIDGPYGGCARVVDAFDCVFLLASGTGVSAIIPFLDEACKKIKSDEAVTNHVCFDWIVRNSENIEWIIPELKKVIQKYGDMIKSNEVEINIHVTEDMSSSSGEVLQMLSDINTSSDSDSEHKSGTDEEVSKTEVQYVNIINAKPSVKELIENNTSKLQTRNIFIVSGSDSMKVQSSNKIASLQTKVLNNQSGVKEIYLHSESFGW